MLKQRELSDCADLFELMQHQDVYPYVRQKTRYFDEFLFTTKQAIEEEERGEIVSRTILDEFDQPIGTISLLDIEGQYGFLGTWLGKPYHGKGYNHLAKEAFFSELFFELGYESVFMKIRKSKGLTFDDVLLIPQRSPFASRQDVNTFSRLSGVWA